MSFRQKGTLEQAPAGLGYIKETSVLEGAIGNAAGTVEGHQLKSPSMTPISTISR